MRTPLRFVATMAALGLAFFAFDHLMHRLFEMLAPWPTLSGCLAAAGYILLVASEFFDVSDLWRGKRPEAVADAPRHNAVASGPPRLDVAHTVMLPPAAPAPPLPINFRLSSRPPGFAALRIRPGRPADA